MEKLAIGTLVYTGPGSKLVAKTKSGATTTLEFFTLDLSILPTGQGTTGDLSLDNPNPGGGYRFFPGAASAATNTVSRNVVRIRAQLIPAKKRRIYFRAFDVDDPSSDAAPVDPNGSKGRDNRGTLTGANFDQPGDSIDPGSSGYQGRLRRIGDGETFFGDGQTVAEWVDVENGVANIELATTFAPGDNFRILASIRKKDVDDLDALSAVPPSGRASDFIGEATPLLTVWRYLNIEADSMAAVPVPRGNPDSTTFTAKTAVSGIPRSTVTVDGRLPEGQDFYRNGRITRGATTFTVTANSDNVFFNGVLPAGVRS